MSDVDAVIELLERWRDASGMQRVRIGIDASRTIGGLPAERKRALAAEVARRVAPQLVPAIEAESGDLTGEQVAALIDLLRRADREQLDDLLTALKGGDVLGALDLVDGTVDLVAPEDERTDALLADLAEPDGTPTAPPPAEADGPAGAAVAAAAAAVDELATREDLDARALAEMRAEAEAAAAQRAERWKDTSQATSSAPAYRAPDIDFSLSFEALDLPDPEVEQVAPLDQRLDQLPGGARAQMRTTPASTGSPAPPTTRPRLASGPITAVVAAVTATPDGYRRRRAALAAIRDGRLERGDVATVVASFTRDTDRAWVAGAALDAGLVDGTDLTELPLLPTARARLQRRVG